MRRLVIILLLLGWLHGGSTQSAFPPALRVSHAPRQPRSGDSVKITVTGENLNPAHWVLQIQVVEPGAYIRKTDPQFSTEWRDIPLKEQDGTLAATVPEEFQKARRLIRYRLKDAPTEGPAVYFPPLSNSCPNFAWFVWDGMSPWSGASRPGHTPNLNFSPEFFATLPAYFLIARADDVRRSQWDQSYNRRHLPGTFVFEGEVYDHIYFHNRGQASTYVAGKNKWGLKFNPAQEFVARDFWGNRFRHRWNGLDLNPCASAWAQVNRGMAGMDEAVGYRAYQLAGVPSPDTFWVQFRVVDSTAEAASQYEGDLWGLYLVVQEKDGPWLRENRLPDGNIYSAEGGPKHRAGGAGLDQTDLIWFRNASDSGASEQWWRAHLDLPAYYSFRALNRLLANIDLRPDGNYYLYHRPDEHWVVLPHDLDMMFIPKSHQPGFVPQARCLEVPAIRLEYQNRAREILDLFASDARPDGGQIGQLVAELSRKIAPPGQQRTWAELDEVLWNWHPRTHGKGHFYRTPCSDYRMGGSWERWLASPDFAGFCRYIVEFCTDSRPRKNYRPNDGDQRGYGFGYLAREANDPKIPARPGIKLETAEQNRPVFSVSPFDSPGSARFAALQWRVAPISAPGLKGYVTGDKYRYELEPCWTRESSEPPGQFELPAQAMVPNHTYRVRARYKDDSGRWSHWSEPVQLIPAERSSP